ncbi:Protein F37C4.5 [Psilocybe cubensis]|uniref:Mucoidy inhibitor A n=2 Tax=Psilocybe cubensis TaxID=181762 RepID=A0A8H7XN88_PSICU|nr:Protein F37C4.5 [Psilocybe cubensis]KAH9480090.1 Protein F37C4.5 [Psilocybe cubensis]
MPSTPSTSADAETNPPPFQPINTVDLVSVEDSKIISVSVYAGRAEITRLFKFNVKTGHNQLNIVGLPSVLDQDSLRVEGRGAATIHDVSISTIKPPPTPTTSPLLTDLLSKEKKTQKALARALKSLSSVETYISSVRVEDLDVSNLRNVVQQYDATAGELDDRVTELEDELKKIDEELKKERQRLAGPTGNDKLNLKATIGVFADFEGEIKIALIYAVHRASWNAAYDIRVDMQTKEKPITLIYKASIVQNTGEDWVDVPLTLETASPTFGVDVPTLEPWTLSVQRFYAKKSKSFAMRGGGGFLDAPPPPRPMVMRSMAVGSAAPTDQMSMYSEAPVPEIEHRGLQVSSKGGVSATFGVPGLITIPSDDVGHNVTIVKLALDADMSWVCVPKKDNRVHLKAKIKNASEYTLLAGSASVYVDGSFISKSDVPLVSPEEKFECPLGLDPSIRVTYHPRTKKVSQSGFYTKSSNHTFTQRITVHNTKASASGIGSGNLNIKVIDQVPISEDSVITVKLVQPALVVPVADGTSASATSKGELKLPSPIKVASGVVAMWDGADEVEQGGESVDIESLGKEGRFCWVCSVPPLAKIGLTLQWEVAAPANTNIYGL